MTSLTHKGFKAWIASEGAKLPVYGIKTEGSTVTCWVPSLPDTSFSVAWKKEDSREVACSGHIFIDGRDVASGVMRPRRKRHVERSAVKVGTTRTRPFYFTALQLTDDEQIAPLQDDRLNEAGIIRLEISWVKLGSEVSVVTTKVENINIAHERAKKAGAMITTFADPERTEKGKAVSTRSYDPDRPGPHVTFTFRYHQKQMLQAWGIAPKPPGQRSRAVIDEDDDEDEGDVKPFTTREVIDLESDNENENESPSAQRSKSASHTNDEDNEPDFAAAPSEAGSEPLYDMGDTGFGFGFNADEEEEESKESLLRATRRVKDEDAMSTTSDGDAEGGEDNAPVKMASYDSEEEEPMEEDD